MTEAELIIAAGKALFGDQWQADLARALTVHRVTVQRWKKGIERPRPGVWRDLLVLAEARLSELEWVISELTGIQARRTVSAWSSGNDC